MPPIRILLGALPTSLLSAIAGAIGPRADVEVVGVATQPTELLLAAGLLRADVLLVPMVDDGLPGIASHVLDQYPHIKIVAISNDGRQVLLCALRPQVFRIITPSLEELIATIRSVARQAAD